MMYSHTDQLDVLLISEHAVWPTHQGFCIRGFNMAKALRDIGVRVGIASIEPPPADAPRALRDLSILWPATQNDISSYLHGWRGPLARVRQRLADYQGRDLSQFAGIVKLVERYRPRAVIGLGQHSPLMLKALRDVPDVKRVWYAADELILFQLSCLMREGIRSVPDRLRKLALYGALEFCFVRGIDGAIGVSPSEQAGLRALAGAKHTITIRNGVDLDYFVPAEEVASNNSIVFWGRMDFEPNIDAVTWFTSDIWPTLHSLCPHATFRIVGKNPSSKVRKLDEIPGVEVVGEVDDIRPLAQAASLTVLPMRCGGGIKNKLLEAAAMGLPILASEKAARGLVFDAEEPPFVLCRSAGQWIETISHLWANRSLSARLGRQARTWVQKQHSWTAAATQLVEWLNMLPGGATIVPSEQCWTNQSKEAA